MNKIKSILVVLALAPTLSWADIIRIEYEGSVDYVSGDGMGYAYGDAISGWFEFDSDDLVDPYGDGRYVYASGPVDSNQSSVVDGVYSNDSDREQLVDDSYSGSDQLYVRDGSYYSYSSGSYYSSYYSYSAADHYLVLYEYGEWLDTDYILGGGSLALSASELPSYSYGYLRDYSYYYSCGSRYCSPTTYRYNDTARFSITALRVNAVSEPGTLALFLIGTVGIAASRRRKR